MWEDLPEETDELQGLIKSYNDYVDGEGMRVSENSEGWYTMWIGPDKITENDLYGIVARIKAILRENGINWKEQG